jgi:hypothetical protein
MKVRKYENILFRKHTIIYSPLANRHRSMSTLYHDKTPAFAKGSQVKFLAPQGWVRGIIMNTKLKGAPDYCRIYLVFLECGTKMQIPSTNPWLTYYYQDEDSFLMDTWYKEPKCHMFCTEDACLPGLSCCSRCYPSQNNSN